LKQVQDLTDTIHRNFLHKVNRLALLSNEV
jgi:hypothetical protein